MPRREKLLHKLEQARRRKNSAEIARLETELTVPEFPRPLAYLWRTYSRLRRRMAGGFAGPNPIGWQDLDAFVRRTGSHLAPWEIETLEALDDAYLSATATAKTKTPASAGRPGAKVLAEADMNDARAVRSVLRSVGKKKGGGRDG